MATSQPIAKPAPRVDQELEEFRNLMSAPSEFGEGFNLKSLVGVIFIALLMIPGSLYMGLLTGGGIGGAAQWVTVILFVEVARRAQSSLKRPEIFVLFYMAGAAMGAPFTGLLWNQFFIRSDAAQATGVAQNLPTWFAPHLDSASYAQKSFWNIDWLPVIGLITFQTIFGTLSNMVLGYGLFRLTSDVEKLPFPMSPVGAQGIMALAEDSDERDAAPRENAWRWRVFSIGGAIGLAFGAVYVALPALTGTLTGTPILFFNIPFTDYMTKSQNLLPAVPMAISWDLGNLIFGMVFPFFAVLGTFIGVVLTMIVNPLLYHTPILGTHVLQNWAMGDDVITTQYKNYIDFYFSFGIGLSIAVALVGFYQIFISLRARKREAIENAVRFEPEEVPKGRGDIRTHWILLVYFLVTLSYILVSGYLVGWHTRVMIVLFFFGFVYTPVISYVTARLQGMVGQTVEIPMIREASFILSGYRGVDIWFIPIPQANYGLMVDSYRQAELTGTKFSSLWKAQIFLAPIMLISSFLFMNFIWSLAEVPSPVYPFAQKMWPLQAQIQCIMYSSTLGDYSIFQQAINAGYIGIGAVLGTATFALLSLFGAPIFFYYGLIGGLSGAPIYNAIPQMIGAVIGKYYFQKRLGLDWRKYVPVVAAGFGCGMGLVTMLAIGATFLSKAVIQLPF